MKKNNLSISAREALKDVPSVDSIILACHKRYDISFHSFLLKKIIKNEIKIIKNDILNSLVKKDIKNILYDRIFNQVNRYSTNSLKSVINATGIVLHTGLGRSPLDKKILKSTIENIYPYSNLEFNTRNNSRGERNEHISYLINAITGSESSIMVNNNAAAVLLALNSLSSKKEVIISRGELVEIGGSFRIPNIIDSANCKMVEVGTTNKTHLSDFKKSITSDTGLIMIAHTSNYRVVGFTENVEVKELVKLGKQKKIPVYIDLGSGAMIDYQQYNLPKEKIIEKYIKMGVDLISFSGDKLIGGPQSGIICGKKRIIKKLHANAMYRALRCDKITISLMESILRTYVNSNIVKSENLTFTLLTRSRKKIKKLAVKVVESLDNKIIKKYNINIVESNVQAGSGSLPIENIESIAIVLYCNSIKPTEISNKLRNFSTPIIGYIKGNKFYIDFKAIPSNQINNLIDSLKSCLQ